VDGRHVLDPLGCPGNPWLHLGSTNGDVFDYDPGFGYTGSNCMRLYKSVMQRFLELRDKPSSDNIMPFIKQEGHKQSKADIGRWRIISGVGATDNLVAEIIFRTNLDELTKYGMQRLIPIGWSPVQHGAIPMLNSIIADKSYCADKSSWDWTITEWLFNTLRDFLCLISDFEYIVVYNHITAILGPRVFELHGMRFEIDFPCMSSGWKLTISANSWWQQLLHIVICLETWGEPGLDTLPVCMGDDTIQSYQPPIYWNRMSTLGPLVKSVDFGKEFCGFNFTDDSYNPLYLAKHGFNLNNLTTFNRSSALTSYQYIYAFDSERLHFIQQWLSSIGAADALVHPDILRGVPRGRVF